MENADLKIVMGNTTVKRGRQLVFEAALIEGGGGGVVLELGAVKRGPPPRGQIRGMYE
jgi:hypothetical protein